ncbi:protein of unknown function [Flavobacterium gillisiae]|uniref:Glycosyltransferase GT-D fold domain-containing protein n=2 Tax=Flavobacterium gillisiae TaxID=150146 RepID=A0A1H4EV87_9FLAO|nr:protein of unknown function [Flavobacterium gillisiae]
MRKTIRKTIIKINYFIYRLFGNRFNAIYELELGKSISQNVKIVSPDNTLDEIEQCILDAKKGAYLRFGDGDVFLFKNVLDSYQVNSKALSIEMGECFSVSGQNVFKCLAIHSDYFGFSEEMSEDNHKNNDEFALKLFLDTYKYFIGSNIYSPVALHFMAAINVKRANFFLKTLKSKTKIFIGNEQVNEQMKIHLFGQKTIHIKTPVKNAYSEIDRIEYEALKFISENEGFFVICVAMGCSGRPLIKRIWNKKYNVFLFDFGSLLDGILGNNSRKWLEINDINYDELLNGLDKIE